MYAHFLFAGFNNAKELQVTVGPLPGVEARCRLRVYQFWRNVLNLARENLRNLHGPSCLLYPPRFWTGMQLCRIDRHSNLHCLKGLGSRRGLIRL